MAMAGGLKPHVRPAAQPPAAARPVAPLAEAPATLEAMARARTAAQAQYRADVRRLKPPTQEPPVETPGRAKTPMPEVTKPQVEGVAPWTEPQTPPMQGARMAETPSKPSVTPVEPPVAAKPTAEPVAPKAAAETGVAEQIRESYSIAGTDANRPYAKLLTDLGEIEARITQAVERSTARIEETLPSSEANRAIQQLHDQSGRLLARKVADRLDAALRVDKVDPWAVDDLARSHYPPTGEILVEKGRVRYDPGFKHATSTEIERFGKADVDKPGASYEMPTKPTPTPPTAAPKPVKAKPPVKAASEAKAAAETGVAKPPPAKVVAQQADAVPDAQLAEVLQAGDEFKKNILANTRQYNTDVTKPHRSRTHLIPTDAEIRKGFTQPQLEFFKDALKAEIPDALAKPGGEFVVKIPDDGTFTVPKTPQAIGLHLNTLGEAKPKLTAPVKISRDARVLQYDGSFGEAVTADGRPVWTNGAMLEFDNPPSGFRQVADSKSALRVVKPDNILAWAESKGKSQP
jgi:hypothetical protein